MSRSRRERVETDASPCVSRSTRGSRTTGTGHAYPGPRHSHEGKGRPRERGKRSWPARWVVAVASRRRRRRRSTRATGRGSTVPAAPSSRPLRRDGTGRPFPVQPGCEYPSRSPAPLGSIAPSPGSASVRHASSRRRGRRRSHRARVPTIAPPWGAGIRPDLGPLVTASPRAPTPWPSEAPRSKARVDFVRAEIPNDSDVCATVARTGRAVTSPGALA